MLLGAPGRTTRNKTLLVTKGIAVRLKMGEAALKADREGFLVIGL